jgi:tryptophan-rich sensory protein
VFFGLRQPGAALAVMAALWLSALGAFALFLAVDLLAGLAFGLYMIWLSYAGALNLSVWRRNPAAARI